MKKNWKVSYVYLTRQFASLDRYWRAVKKVVSKGDFTLGAALVSFENAFAKALGVKYAVGVANGTDALYLALKALGIGEGDEVITPPNSFIATTATIALTGATPVFVDVRDDYTIDPKLIEAAVTAKTKAILPVHLTGWPADMYPILRIAKKHKLHVIEDVAQAAMATYDGKSLGTFGIAGCFSFHPLKILNVWGDGGMITTNDDAFAQKLRLWRNHGLKSREEVVFFAHNSRLDTIQAAVAHTELPTLDQAIAKRVSHAAVYDRELGKLSPHVRVPPRNLSGVPVRGVFATYVVMVENRPALIAHLTKRGIETKVHYPIPIHLQEAAKYLGYKKGDFPMTEKQADTILTLPCHQYLKESDVRYVCKCIEEFYSGFARRK